MTTGDERTVLDWANHLSTAAEASRLAVRLHLLTLLFAVCLTENHKHFISNIIRSKLGSVFYFLYTESTENMTLACFKFFQAKRVAGGTFSPARLSARYQRSGGILPVVEFLIIHIERAKTVVTLTYEAGESHGCNFCMY